MRWLKVIDLDDPQPNRVVSGAIFEVHETSPFKDEEYKRPIAYHYPDGVEREYATQSIESGELMRRKTMRFYDLSDYSVLLQCICRNPGNRSIYLRVYLNALDTASRLIARVPFLKSFLYWHILQTLLTRLPLPNFPPLLYMTSPALAVPFLTTLKLTQGSPYICIHS